MNRKTIYLALICVLPALSGWAGQRCNTCRTSLKALDLSRPPSHEDLIAAGQLGGALSPTGPESQSTPKDRLSFGRAMDAWNRHDYKRAKALLKQHIKQEANSPWKAEAELHLGCESRFNGRYAEAENYFETILTENADKQGTEEGEILHRAHIRLAMLETMRGNFDQAQDLWLDIIRNDPDRVRRDYARNWLRRTGLYKQNAQVVRRCGTEALAKLCEKLGETDAAHALLGLPAHPEYGFSAAELVTLAKENGVKLTGLKAGDVAEIPVPFLAHYAFKHFVAVTARDADGNVTVFDPILNHEVSMTPEEFAREWSGVALVPKRSLSAHYAKDTLLKRLTKFISKSEGKPTLLAASELRKYVGGCCGIENPNTDEGCDTATIGGTRGDGSGLCTLSFGPSSMNIFILDAPLWYEPAIGPPVEFSMSYNAIDADNNLPSFGPKWMFSYHSYAVETPAAGAGTVTVFMPDGANDVYSPVAGTNTYTSPGRVFNQLVKLATNQFTLTMPDGSVYEYGQPAGATNVQQALLSRIVDRHSNAVTLIYDGQPDPKLIAVADALSQTSRIYYSGSGLITNIADPFGRSMSAIYSNGYVATVRDMGGVESRYTFYTNGLEKDYVKTLRTDCGDVSFVYALPDGKSTGTWDRSTVTATYADGSKEILYYTGTGKTRFTDRNGHMTEYQIGLGSAFPYQGTILNATYADGAPIVFRYNAALQVTNVTDEIGKLWSFAYNNVGQMTNLLTPSGYQLALGYTNGGFDLARVTEAGSNVMASLTYTAKRDVETITNALSQAIRFGYDGYGRLTNTLDALSIQNVFEYSTNDSRLSRVSRGGITLATLQHDAIGRTTNQVGPENIPVAFSFDALDRLTALTVASEQPYRWTYQTNSLLLAQQSDRSGRKTTLEYDSLERVHRVTAHDSSFVTFEYDSFDNLTALLDGSGNKTRFVYDTRNRLTQKVYPGGGAVQIAYDPRGLPISHTSGRGLLTTLKYNNDGSLTNVSYSATNTPAVRYSFNARNLVTGMADGWSTNTYGYDALDRLTNLVEIGIAGTQVLTYAYDSLGRMTNLSWKAGTNAAVSFGYQLDTLSRLTGVVSAAGSFFYQYTNAGLQVGKLTYPNADTAGYAYDGVGRLTNLSYSTGEKWTYAYDARDFVVMRVDPATNTYTYKYDEVGRLTEARGTKGTNVVGGYPCLYSYDRVGNRLWQAESNLQRQLKHNSDNQLFETSRSNRVRVVGYGNEPLIQVIANTATNTSTMETGKLYYASQTQMFFEVEVNHLDSSPQLIGVYGLDPLGNQGSNIFSVSKAAATTRTYQYDADGNLVVYDPAAAKMTNTWDAENRLVAMVYTNGTAEFTYDGFDRLRQVKEYTNGVLTNTTRYVWSGMQLLGELDGSNKIRRTFTWGADLSGTVGGAGGIGGLLGIRDYQPSITNYYVRTDGKGNVTQVRWSNGTVRAAYTYSPFGALLSQTNTYSQPFRFSTKLCHDRSGLSYFGYRWYDPKTGRFLSRDGLGEAGGINLYAFVGNNPINRIDPLGLFFTPETAWDAVNLGMDAASLGANLGAGNWGGAALDAAGLLYDGLATAVPGLPGGAGTALKAKRAKKALQCSWSTAKRRYWKERGVKALEGEFSPENLERMRKGMPPLHDDLKVPMELHHKQPRREGGTHEFDNLEELWPWQHAEKDPFRYYNGPQPPAAQ